jgi:glycosyltransferase involved in cell wall biosynthesis
MKKPRVSFVIRTKDESMWIGKVLQFLMDQTFRDFEIIIVDSGSTDKTLEIVKKFPIRLMQIKPEEFNYSYALNLGISKANGKYIGIISGHSIPVSDSWLSDGLKNFKDRKVAAISGNCSSLLVGYFSRSLGRLFFKTYQKKLNFNPWMTNTNSLIRKDLWEQYPFDEKLPECEDYDWASEMIARGYNVIKDPKFNVFHSHFLLGKPGYLARKPRWGKICATIDKRKRPRESYSKTEM